MPATYTHLQYLDRDLSFSKPWMGMVCSSLGLTSLILCTFKRLPITIGINIIANEHNNFFNTNIALGFDLASSSSG
jgi:hypothetical protein